MKILVTIKKCMVLAIIELKKKYFDDSKKLVVVKMKDKEAGVLLLNNFLD